MPTTVTINGNAYDTYVTTEQVDEYAGGSFSPNAAAWDALVADDKSRVVVSVTRWIDSECWQGEKADPDQPLAWPRTVGAIADVEQAAIMLSLLVAANPELPDQMTGAVVETADGGTKRLKAGSVEIEYFRNLNFVVFGSGAIKPFPRNVMALLGRWLCDSSVASWGDAGSSSFGTCAPSVVGVKNKFGFTEGL